MSITTVTRIEVRCDRCSEECWENGTTQWPSIEQAYDELTHEGWQIDDGWHLCPLCARRDDCYRHGHQWTAWAPAPDHAIEWRWCTHCTETDARSPALHDPRVLTTDGSH